ncbi:MAG: nicotinamide-nucleotide amidohydrolase family protein [Chloroflexi bacterium]|nr:nicotinamide-nucleotide amidohydrolase family protein [Chloroflexota bacterium]
MQAFLRRRWRLAVAESCTGGSLAAAITEVPGASTFFLGGIVSYADDVKEAHLGVPRTTLETHGAVSEPTARAMAEGVRQRLGADVGVAITGIAGPDGVTPTKPVGLVFVAVATPERTVVRQDVWPGSRAVIRHASVRRALELTLESAEGLALV